MNLEDTALLDALDAIMTTQRRSISIKPANMLVKSIECVLSSPMLGTKGVHTMGASGQGLDIRTALQNMIAQDVARKLDGVPQTPGVLGEFRKTLKQILDES